MGIEITGQLFAVACVGMLPIVLAIRHALRDLPFSTREAIDLDIAETARELGIDPKAGPDTSGPTRAAQDPAVATAASCSNGRIQ